MDFLVDVGGGTAVQLGFLVFSLLAVGLLSSSEASLISVNKFRVRHRAEQGDKRAQAVSRVVEKHEKFFATVLLTENAFIILSTSVGTALAISLLGHGPLAVGAATAAMTVLIVSLGEITPKSLAARGAEKWAMVVARPIEVVMWLETGALFFFTIIPRLLLRLLGGEQRLRTPSITEGELRMLIEMGHEEGMVERREAELLSNVFTFGDTQVKEVMTPRTEMVWLEEGTTLSQFLAIYAEHLYTRFPVCRTSADDVTGVLSIKDVLGAMARGVLKPEDTVSHLKREAFFVPETKLIGGLLVELRQAGSQVAIAVDEFGGVSGLVTIKRLVEEIVGPEVEPKERGESEFEAIDENTFQLDGGMRVEEANEKLALGIPEGGYETVAGFVLKALGHIPHEGEHLQRDSFRLVVTKMRGVKIEKVLVSRDSTRR